MNATMRLLVLLATTLAGLTVSAESLTSTGRALSQEAAPDTPDAVYQLVRPPLTVRQ